MTTTVQRVLIVNDDGIHAHGLELLESLAREFTDDVWVVAPDEEKSGASHSISLSMPLRVRKLANKRYAVKGTPADCVLLAIWELMAQCPPTVVLSDINHGENLAEDLPTLERPARPSIHPCWPLQAGLYRHRHPVFYDLVDGYGTAPASAE
jgi:5'-nucleotidase